MLERKPVSKKPRLMTSLLVSLLIIIAVVLPTSNHQAIIKRWPQTQVQKLVATAVVVFAVDDSQEWVGAGVIIDKKGTILTAAHVVAGLPSPVINIKVLEGTTYSCERIAFDSQRDLGLVRILNSAQNFPYARVQKSNYCRVGQDLLVIGNPLELYWTVTQGIISRIWCYVPTLSWRFDTDALVNRGNSGGPAFNDKGEVVGIISAMHIDYRGRPTGIGIAIPITEIHKFLKNSEEQLNKPWPKPRLRIGDSKNAV
jgi:serine protease Do